MSWFTSHTSNSLTTSRVLLGSPSNMVLARLEVRGEFPTTAGLQQSQINLGVPQRLGVLLKLKHTGVELTGDRRIVASTPRTLSRYPPIQLSAGLTIVFVFV